jgi:basic amino acid/polyamine antiporter, APA family
MVGTGVFTTTGFLVGPIGSARGIVACWAVGGLAALCGALAYAELATATPESGGEYRFLTRWLHPTVGFVAAFVSLIVGFSAPLAALALAFGEYLEAAWPGMGPPALTGGALVIALSALNAWRVSAGTGFHNLFTAFKIALIAAMIGYGLGQGDPALLDHGTPLTASLPTSGFAVGLILVSFAYTGWNAAAYVAGEVKEPARTLPRALVLGTLLVTALYVALNATFLMAVPLEDLSGDAAVAHRAAVALVGDAGGRWVAGIIALGLVSTIGAIIVTGPRIYEAVGRDVPGLGILARRSARGGPVYAVALQAALALVMLFRASFEDLLTYIGFSLSIFAGLTVACVFRLRARGVVAPFRMPGYPVTPAAFVLLTLWMAISGIVEKPGAAVAGLVTLGVGALVHAVVSRQPRP